MILSLSNVSFSYGDKKVLDCLSFSLQKGEILAVMGESGCGKSTLLNLVAGLVKPQSGEITNHATKISYVFQEPRLFPWLTVKDNLLAVLPDGKEDRALREEKALSVLRAVGLEESAALYPSELSGGMKSRVSLARALLYGGDLFLLDEPFASLNEEMHTDLIEHLKNDFRSIGASAIFVTHQTADAEKIADRILKL